MATCAKPRAAIAAAAAAIVAIAAASLLILRLRCSRRRQISAARRRSCEAEEKPQRRFKRVLADNSYSAFKHLRRREGGATQQGSLLKVHPFEEEITSLLDNPPAFTNFMLDDKCPEMSASYSWISTEAQLALLAGLLSKEKVFAVDTEQHSLRSFLGYTALMQISIHKDDYLIDTIALHDVMGILRPVFADHSICKVFHGADNDILWLQRDFHIYIVNMFDTAKACDVLSKPQKSLAYLLQTYCGVITDKTLQREDWRLRPLSAEMIEYARCDAHYLLYIANCLADELHAKDHDTSDCPDDKFNFFFEASRRSNMVCMQLYVKEIESIPGASSATSIFSRNVHTHGFDSKKSSEAKDLVWKLCAWRDLMARIHDESLRYVLSDQAIAALAMHLPKGPTDVYDVIAEADEGNGAPSLPSPSPVVVAHIEELCYFLEDMSASMDDVFKSFLDGYQDPSGLCRLSVYNYSLVSQLNLKQADMFSFASSGDKLTAPPTKKASRELFIKKFSCKSPVYHNCRIYASDGRLLCYCDRKKLEWNLQRNLAKMVEDDPPAIMLLFEPKGRPEDEDNEFYIQSKKNICVGCGEKSHYIRYRIIPSCYRMHFPEHLKSHRSHDIVLLCVDCHEVAHSAAEKYKKQIAKEFGIPLFVQKIVDSGDKTMITGTSASDGGTNETGVSPLQLRTAAMALLRHGSTMPLKRCEELMQIVKAYYGGRDLTPEDLGMALLVGMSPHERRRLEKKKGLSFRNEAQRIIRSSSSSSTASENLVCDSEKSDALSEELSSGKVNSGNGDQRDPSSTDKDVAVTLSVDTSTFGSNIETFERKEPLEPGSTSAPENGHLNGDLHNSSNDSSSRVISHEGDKKLSLLGHGPHGKQVVDYLLANYGEEGICQFCQRWRQVFVEAIHPQFLPAGWNIKHSGRRDFGDFSVYNPSKKAPESAND